MGGFNSRFRAPARGGGGGGGSTPVLHGADTEYEYDGRRVLIFNSSGTLTVDEVTVVEYLIVGGGGGGANGRGGGGGGGGGVVSSSALLAPGTYAITVGAGGAVATQGGSSAIAGVASVIGGGKGGGESSGQSGGPGACGGGATNSAAVGSGSVGYDGGLSSGRTGGGGGGMGGVGGNGTESPKKAGDGGPGVVSTITGSPVYYGGGGGGGTMWGTDYTPGYGGLGGGGNGENSSGGSTAGTPNTGGGGGGGSGTGRAGGSGVVVVRYGGAALPGYPPGLILRLDASESVSGLTDGDPLPATIPDLSAAGNSGTKVGSPTWVDSVTPNGSPAFKGGNPGTIQLPSTFLDGLTGVHAFMFLYCDDQSNELNHAWSVGNANDGIWQGSADDYVARDIRDAGWCNWKAEFNDRVGNFRGRWVIYEARVDNATATSDILFNGQIAYHRTEAAGTLTVGLYGSNIPKILGSGAFSDSSHNHIAEFVVFDHWLSEADAAAVRARLLLAHGDAI